MMPRLAFFFASLLLPYGSTFAASEGLVPAKVGIHHVAIAYTESGMAPVAKAKKENEASPADLAKKACAAIGKSLLVGQGPGGRGIFDSYSCDWSGTKTGKDPTDAQAAVWHLKMTRDGDKFTAVLSGPRGPDQVFATVKEHVKDTTGHVMTNESWLRSLAGALLEEGGVTHRFGGPAKPQNSEDDDAEMGLTDETKCAEYEGVDFGMTAGGAWLIRRATEPFSLDDLASQQLPKRSADFFARHGWARCAGERDTWRQAMRSIASQRLGSPLDAAMGLLLDNFRGGVVAVRVGTSVYNDDPLLKKAMIVSVLGEFRSGILSGLSVHYDRIPPVSVDLGDEEGCDKMDSSRLLVGRAWSWRPFSPTLAFEATPKLGSWSYEGGCRFLDTQTNAIEGSEFSIKRELTLGLALAVEWRWRMLALRPWGEVDQAFSVFGVEGSAVRSTRLGIDAVWRMKGKWSVFGKAVNPAVLGFASAESISAENKDQDSATDHIDYSVYFAGAGFGVAW